MLVYIDGDRSVYDRIVNNVMVSLKGKGLRVEKLEDVVKTTGKSAFIKHIEYVNLAHSNGIHTIYFSNSTPINLVYNSIYRCTDLNEIKVSLENTVYNLLVNLSMLEGKIKERGSNIFLTTPKKELSKLIDFKSSNPLVDSLVFNNLSFPVLSFYDDMSYEHMEGDLKLLFDVYKSSANFRLFRSWLKLRTCLSFNILHPFYRLRKFLLNKKKSLFTGNDVFNGFLYSIPYFEQEEEVEHKTMNISESCLYNIERCILLNAGGVKEYSGYINLPTISAITH